MILAASFSLKNCSSEILSNSSPPVQSLDEEGAYSVTMKKYLLSW